MIDIHLNGEARQIAAKVDLQELVEQFSLPEKRIAIELNGRVIRRGDWPETIIGEGDNVEVVHFVGGG
jgi:sulfur carrier protein